jgi:hypothetical protein
MSWALSGEATNVEKQDLVSSADRGRARPLRDGASSLVEQDTRGTVGKSDTAHAKLNGL